MFQFHNPQSGQTYSPADGFLSCRGAILAEGGSDRAPHFSPEELELLAEGALAKYPQLYGPSNKQVKSHAKVKIWRAIARSVRTKGVYERNSRHCRKRWEDLRRWTRLTCVHLLGRSTEQKKKEPYEDPRKRSANHLGRRRRCHWSHKALQAPPRV